jgi:hypothetical protein
MNFNIKVGIKWDEKSIFVAKKLKIYFNFTF